MIKGITFNGASVKIEDARTYYQRNGEKGHIFGYVVEVSHPNKTKQIKWYKDLKEAYYQYNFEKDIILNKKE